MSIYMQDTDLPPTISGGSGQTRAVAGVAIAGETIAGMTGIVKVGGLVRTESAEPLALLRDDSGIPHPTPTPATYGVETYGEAVYTPPPQTGAIYGKAVYGQTKYGRVVSPRIGGLARTESTVPLALTRTAGPDL